MDRKDKHYEFERLESAFLRVRDWLEGMVSKASPAQVRVLNKLMGQLSVQVQLSENENEKLKARLNNSISPLEYVEELEFNRTLLVAMGVQEIDLIGLDVAFLGWVVNHFHENGLSSLTITDIKYLRSTYSLFDMENGREPSSIKELADWRSVWGKDNNSEPDEWQKYILSLRPGYKPNKTIEYVGF